jgi:hypothetical protein
MESTQEHPVVEVYVYSEQCRDNVNTVTSRSFTRLMVAAERWLSWLSDNTKERFSFKELVCLMKCCFITSTKLPLVFHSEHAATPFFQEEYL